MKTIDQLGLFKVYHNNGTTPFLLVDGHQTRFHKTFLEYITNEQYHWKVSIGVPYGTSLWQVGDSYQQNSRFKIVLMNSKKQIVDRHIQMFLSELGLHPTDINPMIICVWNLSFADVIGNKQLICEQGLNPLNKNLLLLSEFRRTMTKEDHEEMDLLAILCEEKLQLMENTNGKNPNTHEEDIDTSKLNFNYGFVLVDWW